MAQPATLQKGTLTATPRPTRKAVDATGINVADRTPISPKMPNLPPA